MAFLRCVACLTLLTCAATHLIKNKKAHLGVEEQDDDTPINKVLDLLTQLQKDHDKTFDDEKEAYAKFACFCKDTNAEKSNAATHFHERIDEETANMAKLQASKAEDQDQLKLERRLLEKKENEKHETEAAQRKKLMECEAAKEKVRSAIHGCEEAAKALEGSDTRVSAASMLQLPALTEARETLQKYLSLSDHGVSKKLSATRQKAATLLQSKAGVDPTNPKYEFHSGDIIEVIADLHEQYEQQRLELVAECKKADNVFLTTVDDLKTEILTHEANIDEIGDRLSQTDRDIGSTRKEIIDNQEELQEQATYLQDLTRLCEQRAKDWDQRFAAHTVESTAIAKALYILTNGADKGESVKDKADKVNARTLFLQNSSSARAGKPDHAPAANKTSKVEAAAPKAGAKADTLPKAVSFLQEEDSSSKGFLSRGGLSLEDKKARALATLRDAGTRLGSLALTSLALRAQEEPSYLAQRASGDPFQKVKGLIQRLIERLLEESKAEATKKGFCDESLGKAETERDFRFREAESLSADLARLEAKEDSLEQEIIELRKGIAIETQALNETTIDREAEKAANMETIQTAKDGMEAVSNALLVLKQAYKELAKGVGASFIQQPVVTEDGRELASADGDFDVVSSRASDDAEGMSPEGKYHGAQHRTGAIFALLEQLRDDFDRTVRMTEDSEEAAHRDFIDFSQATKSSIAGKETKKELDTQDLETTRIGIQSKTDDMATAQRLVDAALFELETLKPTCIDTGMSFAEREKKRKQEIEALELAHCLLEVPEKKCDNPEA